MTNIIRYLSPRNTWKEIRFYGYHNSTKREIVTMMALVLGLLWISYMLGLTSMQIVVEGIIFLLFLPRLILNICRNTYEQRKFVDISNYLEQILYSFRRKSKIMNALEDAAVLFPDGNMGRKIQETLKYITSSNTEGDLYREAFSIIESEYNCEIIRRIHNFMIRVEANGGEHQESSDILIYDRNKWVSRILSTQKEKRVVRRNVTIGMVLSLLIITATAHMVPADLVDIKQNLVSQLSTMFTLICNFLLWVFVQCRLSNSWIESEKSLTEEKVIWIYNGVMAANPKRAKGDIIIAFLILGLSIVIAINTNVLWAIFGIALSYLVSTKKNRSYHSKKKQLCREVSKEFPDWILSLSLLLQIDNVQGAIHRSIAYAPTVLKKELEIMIEKIELQPIAIEPYVEFYEKLYLQDVQSAMRILYSMNQNGGSDRSKQIYSLVERNSELQEQSEKMKTEDYLAGMSICVLIPMLIGCGKMMVDMGILMYGLMSSTQGFF